MNSENEGACNLEITIKIIGSKWNLMILYKLSDQTLRFTELQKGSVTLIQKLSQNI